METLQPAPTGRSSPTVHRRKGAGPLSPHTRAQPRYAGDLTALTSVADLEAMWDVNGRCLEAMVKAARMEDASCWSLVGHLREPLRQLTTEALIVLARRPVLLVDMHFADPNWWQRVKAEAKRPSTIDSSRGAFSRQVSIPLARATLMLAWHTIRSERDYTCLLGIVPAVSEIIGSFSLTEIDGIVGRHCRHLRPRWEDRPTVWRALLDTAQCGDSQPSRKTNVYALQLLSGDLWPSILLAKSGSRTA